MKKSKFTEERAECRSRNCAARAASAMRPSTSGAKFGGMQASKATRLREMESENAKLKKLLAEAHLHIEALKVGFGVKR